MVNGLLDKRHVLVNFTYSTFNRNSNDVCRDIAITSQMRHLKNVLKLIGCCLEYAEPVMVYEYVEEAITLHDLLFNNDHARIHQYLGEVDCGLPMRLLQHLFISIANLLHPSFIERPTLTKEAEDGVRATCSTIVTQTTDVYGFGNVLFQLLTGKRMYMVDGVITNLEQTFL
ncbi:hypothetical protein RND71_015398 [Anisodus tanguticus]|uniref:Protein kinase domain-containing protein n=1 Tax=Anisodus tanguticus TaxID=243964 RepID=A0AAE1S665_9SOLA|nr:hypothetical protein RND71_015398 [Anisodus tanguticus]